jgi:acyl-CoA dehydrogenase
MTPPTQDHADIRDEVSRLCARFDGSYWRKLDRENAYPTECVQALTDSGYLSALIPGAYGGSGLTLSAAAAILEEIQRSGGYGGACHAQRYIMGTLLRHGNEQQKRTYRPRVHRRRELVHRQGLSYFAEPVLGLPRSY